MKRSLLTALTVAGCAGLALTLSLTLWDIARVPQAGELRMMLYDNLSLSGVEHPVTAVLLNFRSYDTLLEIGVLLIAAISGMSLSGIAPVDDANLCTRDSLVHALQRWFVPLMLVLAAYLLWAGADRPGGAFQAGAVLAATGVMLRLGGGSMMFLRPGWQLRWGLVLGFSVFLCVGLMGAATGSPFLTLPLDLAKTLILLIETALTLSIGLVLLTLFAAAPVSVKGTGNGVVTQKETESR